jgi:hypothetical protein
MKLIKTLGFTAIAAIAAMALLGANSAMANTSTSLCKVSTNPCPPASLYPSGTVIEGLAVNPVFLGTFFGIVGEIECDHSVISGKTEGALSQPLVVKVTLITFTGNCESTFGGTCTITTAKTGKLDLLRTGPNAGIATSLGNEITVACSGFPSIECTFGGEPPLAANGSSTKTLTANNAPLVAVSGSACPSSPRWDAKYSIIKPTGEIFINQ